MSNPYQTSDMNELNGPLLLNVTDKSMNFVRVAQIVTVALVLGASSFMTFALLMNDGNLEFDFSNLAWFTLGFAALAIVLHVTIPPFVAHRALAEIDFEAFAAANDDGKFERLMPSFQSQHIVACALLEGAAFLNLALFQTNPFVGHLVAAAVLIGLIIVRFPTLRSVQAWMEAKSRLIPRG